MGENGKTYLFCEWRSGVQLGCAGDFQKVTAEMASRICVETKAKMSDF